MLYESFQTFTDLSHPMRTLAAAASGAPLGLRTIAAGDSPRRALAATCELIALAGLTHTRPAFGIAKVATRAGETAVREEVLHATPFGSLLHFRKEKPSPGPRVLLVAPLSGHFASLLRGTVRTLLAEHDVYITDWHNPRDVPPSEGRFGLDEYVLHLVAFIERMGAPGHVVAVCQPTVAALAAVALMAEDNHPAQPCSLTLMAGPIDTRVNPTKVNELATSRPIEWFEANLIATVPPRYAGGSRRVYPGFVQLGAFMHMNLERHLNAFAELFRCRVEGDHAKADATRKFYEEYFATMDLTAEFYLETVRTIFQEQALAKGTLEIRGRRVNPGAIRRMGLLTVEGERDDICAVGQTLAAQDLCSGLRPYLKTHHVQPGVGHYGVFNGKKWDNSIYPVLRDVIQMTQQTLAH
ncbi:MAG TPA: polyhydroxyalkanoate depolymerase [Burkholderiales bacterium]|nr:polyhydroxyalkanoate depolymerase [Burkholderiales bacterium]